MQKYGEFELSHDGGHMDLQPDMQFTWNDTGGEQAYLLKRTVDGKPNDREVEKSIEELVLTPAQQKK